MATVTKVPFDKKYIEEFSAKHNEPAWMKDLRLEGLELADSLELPKPDKTKIDRWNFTEFKHTADGAAIDSLENAPAALTDFIDTKNENIVILRNQSVAYASISKKLEEQGVIFTDIFTALS